MEKENRFLTEAMGECWHIWELKLFGVHKATCKKCGLQQTEEWQNDFFTREGFGKLWEWAQKQKWWNNFILGLYQVYDTEDVFNVLEKVGPALLATSLYNYLSCSHLICSCGGVSESDHILGSPDCFREVVKTNPRKVGYGKDLWFVEGHTITGTTLRQQRGYSRHENGQWSRPKKMGSGLSLPEET